MMIADGVGRSTVLVAVNLVHCPWEGMIALLICLPLGGCDLVLGVQWFSTISPVLWDFQKLTMEFTQHQSITN